MKLSTEDLIKGFYKEIREKYPNLSLDDVRKICDAPFSFIRFVMETGRLATIHIKFLGKFLVYPGRVKSTYKAIKTQKEKGVLSEEEYNSKVELLEEYLNLQDENISKTNP